MSIMNGGHRKPVRNFDIEEAPLLAKLDKTLSRIEGLIVGTMMLCTTIILFVNVIFRSFAMASTWAEEVIRYVIVWVTFFGGSLCAKQGNHVGIDVFVQMFPSKKGQRIIRAIGYAGAAVFCAFATFAAYKITALVISTNQKSPAVLMPFWLVYIAMPLGFALMTLRFIVASITVLRSKDETTVIEVSDSGEIDMTYL
jgi:C4-dicarboxylate transporter DctQ subunit